MIWQYVKPKTITYWNAGNCFISSPLICMFKFEANHLIYTYTFESANILYKRTRSSEWFYEYRCKCKQCLPTYHFASDVCWHMHEYAQDAMTYVHQYGRPDFFITFTCIPTWIKTTQLHLLPGQSSSDQHDITAQVFKQKFKVIMNFIVWCLRRRLMLDVLCGVAKNTASCTYSSMDG